MSEGYQSHIQKPAHGCQGQLWRWIWTNMWASLVHHVLARSCDWYHFNTSILVLVGLELRMCTSKKWVLSKWNIFPYLSLILTLIPFPPTLKHLWHFAIDSLSGTYRDAGSPGKHDIQEIYNSPEERGGHSSSSYLLFEAGCSQRGEGLQCLQPDHASLDLPDVGGKEHHDWLSK